MIFSLIAAAGAAAASAYLGFAPIGWWWVPGIAFAVLSALVFNATSVKRAALIGFVFGLTYFLTGVSWVRISLNEFGGMPLLMAWFAAFLFAAFLALYATLACAFAAWVRPKHWLGAAFVFACAWTFGEYLRAYLFTGFEWLSVGASQTHELSFMGWASLFGVFGATWMLIFASAILPQLVVRLWDLSKPNRRWINVFTIDARLNGVLVVLFGILIVNVMIAQLRFSEPIGDPIRVSLLQGNVAQSMKWEPEKFAETLQRYERLVTAAKGELIILPETAFPAPLHRIPPEYLERLRGIANAKGANLVFGVPVQEKDKFYNAAVSIGAEPTQQYRKVHLVPFGEYMPLRGLLAWFYANLSIPMSDFSKGAVDQSLMKLNGQVLGISICYEDAFSRDVHRTLPEATLLVNISNDAWFGKSAAAEQHLQLAQLRAIEFARPMLRSNNTGVTAVIDEHGRVKQRIESFTTGILETTIQGRKGYTPYMMWGDLPILIVCLAGLGIGTGRRLAAGKRPPESAV